MERSRRLKRVVRKLRRERKRRRRETMTRRKERKSQNPSPSVPHHAGRFVSYTTSLVS